MALHRRIKGLRKDGDDVPTLCGRVVNYQQASHSLINVDCPGCIRFADIIVDELAGGCAQLVAAGLAKPFPKSTT